MSESVSGLDIPSLVNQIGKTRLVPIQRLAVNDRGNRIFGKLEGTTQQALSRIGPLPT